VLDTLRLSSYFEELLGKLKKIAGKDLRWTFEDRTTKKPNKVKKSLYLFLA